MAEEPDSLVLRYLRRIDEKLDRAIEDVRDPKVRVAALEENLVRLEPSIAGVNRRIDRVEERLSRIEKRLDLVDMHL